jgi:hypothetical protein
MESLPYFKRNVYEEVFSALNYEFQEGLSSKLEHQRSVPLVCKASFYSSLLERSQKDDEERTTNLTDLKDHGLL